ncbi:MAG TPA: hypothetical protein VE078_06710 [Thermoanaerobaculia bacterium]|nr:hypothetical protein [Thermoanaerobaculia bacterium]
MLITPQANIFQVQVEFHPHAEQKFIFSGDVDENHSIKIPPGLQMINFMLSTFHPPEHPSESKATFDIYPIAWLGTPPLQPAQGLGQWFDESRCSVVIFSLNEGTHTFGFRIIASYEGSLHESHDPSIVNDPPVG